MDWTKLWICSAALSIATLAACAVSATFEGLISVLATLATISASLGPAGVLTFDWTLFTGVLVLCATLAYCADATFPVEITTPDIIFMNFFLFLTTTFHYQSLALNGKQFFVSFVTEIILKVFRYFSHFFIFLKYLYKSISYALKAY
jgi:hypothetical protein